MLTDARLVTELAGRLGHWSLDGAVVTPLGGGMNSATALVEADGRRYVAKWVPTTSGDALLRGVVLAARLAERGLVTGPALPTLDGDLLVAMGGGWCTVAEFVPGEPLSGQGDGDQPRMARVLARGHTALAAEPGSDLLAWLRPGRTALDLESWVRPTLRAALAAYDALPPLTHAWLHTDPAPEAFRHDVVTGRTGLIDWTGAQVGPVLYDVASAVMYLGGPAAASRFLAAYAGAGVLPDHEWGHLDVLRRCRWAVQAGYFADRLAANDLTGTDAAGNAEGLADARRGLAEWA